MPNIQITPPATAAPVDRVTLTVGWARPGASGIDPVNPANSWYKSTCFEGSAE